MSGGATNADDGTARLTVRPANEATCRDLDEVFGTRGTAAKCRCQRFRTPGRQWDAEWPSGSVERRVARHREQTACGDPHAGTTSGLVAYLGVDPVGWCAVAPRASYARLGRTPWTGRTEDASDASVWAVACFVVRSGFRRRGVSRTLASAAVDFARERGARALEGYPMITRPGQDIAWGELHVGSHSVFLQAGFREVARPSLRRAAMRIDF